MCPQNWKKTRTQIFFACIVPQTLLGITPGLIFLCFFESSNLDDVNLGVGWIHSCKWGNFFGKNKPDITPVHSQKNGNLINISQQNGC